MLVGFRAYFVLLTLIAILITIFVGYFIVQTFRETEQKPKEVIEVAPSPPEIIKENPLIRFVLKGGKFVVEWENLPLDTSYLDVFRRKGKGLWEKWRTIVISAGDRYQGSAEIQLAKGEAASGYMYYAQATSGGNTPPLWSSSSTTATVESPIPISPPPATPTSTPPPTSETSSVTSPPATPPSTSTTQATDTIIYYTPSGEVSGTASTTQTANFWVLYVHNQIEINWQNLPSNTNKFFVERSTSSNGPWTLLLEQKDPDVIGPSFIRVLDDSVSSPHYYRMRVFEGTTLLQTYGPQLLNPIGQ